MGWGISRRGGGDGLWWGKVEGKLDKSGLRERCVFKAEDCRKGLVEVGGVMSILT